jgi:hypothetical protein
MKLPRLLTSAGGTIQRRTPTAAPAPVEVRGTPIPEWYQTLFSFNGSQYLVGQFRNANARHLLGACGPVYAVLDRRASIMGEARPAWQRFSKGKPTDLYSTPALETLKRPWPGGSFRQLVGIAEADAAAGGNSYWIRPDRELIRFEADWVTIVTGAVVVNGVEVGHRLLGYAVEKPGGKPTVFEPDEVAHYRPGPSSSTPFRGESWLASVASDASSDIELTHYKGNYLKNGGLPSLAVMYEPTLDMAQLEAFVPVFAEKFTGSVNAGKVMHFLGGRDVKTLGANLDQLAFKATQGAGETRIAAAAGVPASVAGFSEGMQGSSLNAGNYTATRRLFGDAKIRPLLGSFCEAFSTLVPAPEGSRLWYDDTQVSFFQEDVTDEANIRQLKAQTLRNLVDAGFTADSAVVAVETGDFTSLAHSGLFSVQLQPPGANTPTDGSAPSTEGG